MMYDPDVDPFFLSAIAIFLVVVIAVALVSGLSEGSAESPADGVRLTQKCYEPRYVRLDEHQFQRLIEALEKGAAK